MDAVVVARTEVNRGKTAVLEFVCQLAVAADQGSSGKVVALGLKDLIAPDRTELADRTIHRTNEVGRRQRPRIATQRAGEKFIEAGITCDIRIGRLRHVHAITPDKPAYQPGRQLARPGIGDVGAKGGQRLLGQ